MEWKPTEKLREFADQLFCPVCGDSRVAFSSEASVRLGTMDERTLIFTCPESHTFFVPYRTLQDLRTNLSSREQTTPSPKALEARVESARARLQESSQQFIALKAKLVQLKADLCLTHAALQLAFLEQREIVAEYRKDAESGTRLCLLIDFSLHIGGKRQSDPIQ